MELVKVQIESDEVDAYNVRLVTEGTPMTYPGAYRISKDLFERFKAAKEAYQAVEVELDTVLRAQRFSGRRTKCQSKL